MLLNYFKRHSLSLAGILLLVLISVLPVNSPENKINDSYLLSIRLDYLLHFGVFFVWSIIWCWWEYRLRDRQKIFWTRFIAIGILLAAGIEIVQGLIPWRTFNINDVIANILGVLLGTPFLFIIQKTLNAKRRTLNSER